MQYQYETNPIFTNPERDSALLFDDSAIDVCSPMEEPDCTNIYFPTPKRITQSLMVHTRDGIQFFEYGKADE